MMMKKVIFLLGTLSCSQAMATIDVLPKLIEVQGKTLTTVTVINRSDHPEFVSVALSRLLNPGVPWGEERLEPVGQAHTPQLYAYPFRLSLAKGQSKTITLQPLSAVQQETVWRLNITSVAALSGSTQETLGGGVAVNLSFSTLVRQLPEKQTRAIEHLCGANRITLTATGTTRFPVKGMTVDGVPLETFNVYPGTPVAIAGHHAVVDGKVVCH